MEVMVKPPAPQTWDEVLNYIRYLIANRWVVKVEHRCNDVVRLTSPEGWVCCPVNAIAFALGMKSPVDGSPYDEALWSKAAEDADIPYTFARRLMRVADGYIYTGWEAFREGFISACGLVP